MSKRRIRGLEKQLKRLISSIMRDEIDDPEIKLLSVTDVDLTPDLSMATVFVSHIAGEGPVTEKIIKRLRRNEKNIRARITKKLSIRTIPKLRFREDTSIREAAHLSDIMEELKNEREQRSDSSET
jgi:ribosome-binding factor A